VKKNYITKFKSNNIAIKNRNLDFVCIMNTTKSKFRHIYLLGKLITYVD